MNITGRKLTDLMTRILKPKGFKRKRNAWIISSGECFGMINLQKSNYSNSYYVNVGLSPRELLDDDTVDEEWRYALRTRTSIFPGCHSLEKVLEFEEKTDQLGAETEAKIMYCLNEEVIPFILSHLTVASLRDLLKSDLSKQMLWNLELPRLLDSRTAGPNDLSGSTGQ